MSSPIRGFNGAVVSALLINRDGLLWKMLKIKIKKNNFEKAMEHILYFSSLFPSSTLSFLSSKWKFTCRSSTLASHTVLRSSKRDTTNSRRSSSFLLSFRSEDCPGYFVFPRTRSVFHDCPRYALWPLHPCIVGFIILQPRHWRTRLWYVTPLQTSLNLYYFIKAFSEVMEVSSLYPSSKRLQVSAWINIKGSGYWCIKERFSPGNTIVVIFLRKTAEHPVSTWLFMSLDVCEQWTWGRAAVTAAFNYMTTVNIVNTAKG